MIIKNHSLISEKEWKNEILIEKLQQSREPIANN